MRKLILIVLAAAGCGTDEVPSIAFVSPAPGATFERNALGETGSLVAHVPIELDVGGDVARVTVTRGNAAGFTVGDPTIGDADAEGTLTADIRAPGMTTLTATAYDEAGTLLTSASVQIAITEAQAASCHDWLDLYQLDYSEGPSNPGIEDPVTITLPLNGVAYRYNGNTERRKTLYGDCALMKSLAEAAPIMRERDIVEFVDIGIYNYRCINQSQTPPNCTLSQHAYAKAIDIAAFITGDGTKYSVLTDWLIDPATTTCTAETEAGKDRFLHEVICALKAANVWNIVLTPNYNAAHRNHFHVDLTEGADTIKRDAPLDYRLVLDGASVSNLVAD